MALSGETQGSPLFLNKARASGLGTALPLAKPLSSLQSVVELFGTGSRPRNWKHDCFHMSV